MIGLQTTLSYFDTHKDGGTYFWICDIFNLKDRIVHGSCYCISSKTVLILSSTSQRVLGRHERAERFLQREMMLHGSHHGAESVPLRFQQLPLPLRMKT
jgi:hypothetical protein